MNKFRFFSLVLACLVTQSTLAAVKIVQCEDEQGNRSFHSACPPGTTQVGERRVATGVPDSGGGAATASNITATLYYVPDCASCDSVRDYLEIRNIPVTEKNVFDNVELQTEMKDLTGRENVPVVVIGESVIIGYNRTQMEAALASMGYVEAQEEAAAQ